MKKSLFDKMDFLAGMREIYVTAFKREQEKLQELNAPQIKLKNEEQILEHVEEEIITDVELLDPFDFAKEILANKYGVKPESIRKKLPEKFTKKLRSALPQLTEKFAHDIVEDSIRIEIDKRIDNLIRKKKT